MLSDEHLPRELVRRPSDLSPGSIHFQALGLRGRRGRSIWEFARDGDFSVVSRDSDFEQLAITLGAAPKVIIVRSRAGETSTIEAVLRKHA